MRTSFSDYGYPKGMDQIAPGRDLPQQQPPQGQGPNPLQAAIVAPGPTQYPIDDSMLAWRTQAPRPGINASAVNGGEAPEFPVPPPPGQTPINDGPNPNPGPDYHPPTPDNGPVYQTQPVPNPTPPAAPITDPAQGGITPTAYGEVPGYNLAKIQDEAGHNEANGHAKYDKSLRQLSAALGATNLPARTENLQALVDHINAHGGTAHVTGKDSIDFGDGHGPQDVIFSAGEPGHAHWQMLKPWLNTPAAPGAGGAAQPNINPVMAAVLANQQSPNGQIPPYYHTLLNELAQNAPNSRQQS